MLWLAFIADLNTYRPDLDGGIEWSDPGTHLHIGQIVGLSTDDDFGWLHPAAPLDFILDDQVWRSAKVADWPAPLRRALKRSKEPNVFYRRTLERALTARFAQRPTYRQRLIALRYPVHCKDVPDGLIEEVVHDFVPLPSLLPTLGFALHLLRPYLRLG